MSEIIEIIGIDPSVRFTGIGKVTYNTETKKIFVSNCQVLVNKTTLKGVPAMMNMLEMLEFAASEPQYAEAPHVVVESPVMPFYAKFQGSSMIMVAHIAGGATALFGIDRTTMYRPSEWNKTKKKEKTHSITQELLGSWDTWNWSKVAKRKDQVEHVLDAVSMALYHLQKVYIDL